GKDRLSQKASEAMPSVSTLTQIVNQFRRFFRQTQSVVEFPVQQHPAIGTYRRTPKFHLDRAIKFQPK
ncbi:MAG TPA: hypothetical protein VMV98_02795, partial [Acidobacteriaceae bacterium]|nr:hypothetical protein [Acidobacteriaceae bacterium]